MATTRKKTNTREGNPTGFLKLCFKLSKESFAEHYLFVKNHNVRDTCAEKPQGRTLFVLNVPPYYDDSAMKELFKKHGEVETVHFHSNPTSSVQSNEVSKFFPEPDSIIKGFKVAYVVFKNPNGLKNVLRLKDCTVLQSPTEIIEQNVGLQKWVRQYNDSIIDTAELQKEVDEYMELYDESVEKEVLQAKESEGIPDSDGWIKVTKHGKRPVIPRHEAVEKKISKKEKKKRSQKHLLNFYTFQIKQSKMDSISQLRKKFEEDKKRIALMKMTRKFKPL